MRSPFRIGSIGKMDRGENELLGTCYALSNDRFVTVDCRGYRLQEASRGIATLREYAFRRLVNELYLPLEVVLLLRDCQKSKVVEEERGGELWGTYGIQERDGKVTLAFWRDSDTTGIVLYPDEFRLLCSIVEGIEPHEDKEGRIYTYRSRRKGEHVRFLKIRGEVRGKTWMEHVPRSEPNVDEYGRRRGMFRVLIHPMAVSTSGRIETPCYLFGRRTTLTTVKVPDVDEGGFVFSALDKRLKWSDIHMYLDHYRDHLWTETFSLSAGDVLKIADRLSNWQERRGEIHEKEYSLSWEWEQKESMMIFTALDVFRDDGSKWQFHLPMEEWWRLVIGTKEIPIWFEATRKEKENEH